MGTRGVKRFEAARRFAARQRVNKPVSLLQKMIKYIYTYIYLPSKWYTP
jgi:hypothetical protein